MRSIFNLKTDVSELKSSNEGTSRMSYDQHPPTRDATGVAFSNGAINFRFETSGQKWWLPCRSYLRMRIRLTDGAGAPLNLAAEVAPNMGLMSSLFQSGEFRINDKVVSRIGDFIPQVDALDVRLNKSKSWLDSIGAVTNWWEAEQSTRLNDVASNGLGRRAGEFELVWQPPLSLFKIDHALPGGKYELVLNPQTVTSFQKHGIESTLAVASKVPTLPGGAAGDFKLDVVDFYMYCNTVDGPRADNITYLLDLEQTRCQASKIDNTSFGQKNFDVSPSSYALTVAYQDTRVGENTALSVSKFKSYNAIAIPDTSQELKLNRLFVNYAGQNLPAPDADPKFVPFVGGGPAGIDYTIQRYAESQMYSGAYFDTGGAETITDFHNRGAYYYFAWPRDGTDKSTRVNVHQGFDGADVTNMRILLFDHSKMTARVRVQDGRVISVDVEDA